MKLSDKQKEPTLPGVGGESQQPEGRGNVLGLPGGPQCVEGTERKRAWLAQRK